MTKALTDASTFPTAITPQTGEKVTEALLEACFQALANRTKYLYDNLGGGGPALAANQVYGRSSAGAAGGKTTTDFAFSLLAKSSAVGVADAINTKGADIASAGTTNIAGATGAFVHITGTTTITSFGTAAAGVVRHIRFADALTLTHNATSLILPGAANITTATNDTAIAVSEGSGNWRVISYMRASGASAVNTFAALTDTPGSFSGQALRIPQVNSGETALEFVNPNVFPVATIHYLDHSLSGLNMSDYSVGDGDYVVLWNQDDPTENGVWVASSGAWSRLAPWDTAAGFKNGQLFVSSGISTGSGGSAGAVVVDGVPSTVGSDPITFRSLYRPWITESSIFMDVDLTVSTLEVSGSISSNLIADFDGINGAIKLPTNTTANRDGWAQALGWFHFNQNTFQPEWWNGTSWDPRFVTMRIGDTGSQVAVLDIESTGPASSPLIHIENSTTVADFDIGGGSSVPSHSAPAGSLWVRSAASGNAALYQNTSASSPGTTWSQLASASPTLPTGYLSGLPLSWVDSTTVRIGTGACRDDGDTSDIIVSSNIDIDIEASGANGQDASYTADAIFWVWLIDGGAVSPAGLLSSSATSPTMPSGSYTVKRRIGWIKATTSDSGTTWDAPHFICSGNGRARQYDFSGRTKTNTELLSSYSPTGSGETVAISGMVPTDNTFNKHRLALVFVEISGSAGNQISFYVGGTVATQHNRIKVQNGTQANSGQIWIPVGTSHLIGFTATGGTTITMSLMGVKDLLP